MGPLTDTDAMALQHVVVLGGGVIGSSIAYHLSQAGATCTVIEQLRPAAAASSKAGGFLASGWGDGKVTERLHRTSFAMHEELARTLDLQSYRRLPTFRVDPAGGRIDGQGDQSDISWLDASRASTRLIDQETAQVDPLELTTALLAAARASERCDLRIDECVGVTLSKGSMRECTAVRLASGEEVSCDSLVVALGPWSCKVEDWFDIPLPIDGVWSTSLVYDTPPAIRAAPPAALFVDEDKRGCHLEIYPRPNGELYISGCGGSRIVPTADLQDGAVPPAESNVPDALRARAAEASLAELAPTVATGTAPARQQACMRPCTPDGLPVMGVLPGVRNAYVAAGHNAWGILWAPVTGLAMSQLIVDGEASVANIKPFSPRRFDTLTQRTLLRQRGRQRGDDSIGEQW